MIEFKGFKPKKFETKSKFSFAIILNFIISLFVGAANILVKTCVFVVNLICAIGISFYRKLIKIYKYEFLYIAIVSFIIMILSINCLNGMQANQKISFLSALPNGLYIGLIVLFGLLLVFGLYMYIMKIFLHKKINDKYFWYIRGVSYFVTLVLILFAIDICILDFVSRYQSVIKPGKDTGSYDIMIYFLREYNKNFVDGIKTTLQLALLGTVFGLILALLMVSLRMLTPGPRDNDFVKFLKKIGSSFANLYVTVIRGTPMIVQAFVFYFLIASIVRSNVTPDEYKDFLNNVWTPFRAGLFTVSVNTTAYLTEVLRGGINSVDKGQKEAALALGLGKFRTMMLIVFPQAIKNSFPSIGNEFIVNIKDTSVLTMIGILDLFSVAKNDILGKYSAKSLEAYFLVAIFYLILTFFTSKLLHYIERNMDMNVKEITSSN